MRRSCKVCHDTGWDQRDWMGPTAVAPYPRFCRACSSGRRLARAFDRGDVRAIQVAWTTWVIDTFPEDAPVLRAKFLRYVGTRRAAA